MSSFSNSVNSGFSLRGGERESIASSLREIWRFRALVLELVRRDLKVRYKNRVGGILWSLFPPLMQVLTIWLMVKFFLQNQIPNYSAYLMAVMFLWQFFQNTVLDASQAMIVNAPLARKIYFPARGFAARHADFQPLALWHCVRFRPGLSAGFKSRTLGFAAFLLVGAVLRVGFGTFALGLGYLLAYLTTLYDDVKFLSVTMLGLFFYLVPVLYPIERIAAQSAIYPIYMLNPAAVWLVGFQRALLPPITKVPGLVPLEMPIEWLGISAITSALVLLGGFWIFERSKWMMMERL